MTLPAALPLAQALIRCASVTPADEGALSVLTAALQPLGFVCTRLPFGNDAGRPRIENLYARRGNAGPNICFAGHTDVVPVGSGWTLPPFGGQVIDDHLTGRGAADMKGAIACFVAAVGALLTEGEPSGSISLLITGDEEGPATDGTRRVLDWLRSRGERLDACVVGEPTNPQRVGDMIKIGRRGSLNASLVVLGSQGHAAYPDLADNPLPRLIDMLKAISGEPLDGGTPHFQTSNLALTSIDVGNPATNIIPGVATASFNIRFSPLHSFASLEAWLRARLDAGGGTYQLHLDPAADCFLTAPGPLTTALERAIREVTGISPLLSTSGGTSDARFIKDFCPVAEFGLVNRTMHKTDERVPLADLHTLTRIYHQVLRDLCPLATC